MEATTPTKFVGFNYETNNIDYDPDFNVEISKKMRVPDKISIVPDIELRESKIEKNQFDNEYFVPLKQKLNYMHVPDRIFVNNINKEKTDKEQDNKEENENLNEVDLNSFDNKIDCKISSDINDCQNNEEEIMDYDLLNESIFNKSNFNLDEYPLKYYNSFNNSFSKNTPNNEIQIIKKHIQFLNRRVFNLERESRNRYHRELIIYLFGIIYITAKSLFWFQRMW